jgi:hypothetical protein
MLVDHFVDSLEDAVKLAERWRAEGRFRWFRGQAQLWPLVSSLGRQIKAGDVSAAETRIGHFVEWVGQVPQLQYLLEEQEVHAFFAVLQHYGVPTHYVDFTTEPDIAGFFAAHDPSAIPDEQGCIIGIDSDGFVDTLQVVAEVKGLSRDAWPEKVNVTVAGLWRMQAQSGHFVYLPIDGVERWYGYDRILFRHDGRPHPIPVERIYPTRKSSLEIALDEFFTEELMRNNQIYFAEMLEQWKRQGIGVEQATYEDPDEAAYLNLGAAPHSSWSSIDPRWFFSLPQTYSAATLDPPQVVLTVTSDQLQDIRLIVRAAIQDLLASNPTCRESAASWIVTCDGVSQQDWNIRVERVWDGMRGLPYSTEQLTEAVTAIIAMSMRGQPEEDDYTTLELASERGVTSRAYASTARIRGAYRDDINVVLREPALADTPRLLLQALRNPAVVFDFGKLVDLFATDIIPAQVLSDRNDLAIFYSPAMVPILGKA